MLGLTKLVEVNANGSRATGLKRWHTLLLDIFLRGVELPH